MWAYADQGSYKMALRQMFKKYDSFVKQSVELQGLVNQDFSDEVLFKGFVNNILGFDSSLVERQEEVVMEFE